MPKDPHITGGIRHDWKAIKHEYVTNPEMSLRKIAKKYGVSENSIYKKSKAEGWFATRKKHQARVVAKGIAKTEEKQADELAEEIDYLMLMKDHVGKMLHDGKQFNRHTYIDLLDGTLKEKVCKKVDTRAMKDSMQILQMLESMTRSLHNIEKAERLQKQQLDRERFEFDKEIQRERLAIEKERIALERERNALRNGNIGVDNDKQYGVVLMPEVIDDGN